MAWGDYDGDGDLDLAVGNWNEQPNRLYRNDGGALTSSAIWSSTEVGYTLSVAWGDYDGDGDLDLAVGNSGNSGINDPEGPNRLYRNDGGALMPSAVWEAAEEDLTYSVAWGDYDGDGDLDLAVANVCDYWDHHCPRVRLYRNTRDARLLPGVVPTVRVAQPGVSADFYSSPAVGSGLIPITYTLAHPQGAPVKTIRTWYSLDGGGRWLPAAAANGVITTNLVASPAGTSHTFNWDVANNGLFGQSDNAVFRIQAIPAVVTAQSNSTPGPYLYGAYASSTFPFRVRGTQVRVMEGGAPAKDALVYRLPAGQTQAGEPMTDRTGQPFKTDRQGYLQGRGTIGIGDRLLALSPITATESYTLYHTSAAPTITGLNPFTMTAAGVQPLTVSADNPLMLFNLDVSLEWDASNEPAFLSRLQTDLVKAARPL